MHVERVRLACQDMLEDGLGCVTCRKRSKNLKLQVAKGACEQERNYIRLVSKV